MYETIVDDGPGIFPDGIRGQPQACGRPVGVPAARGQPAQLDAPARQRLSELLDKSQRLKTVQEFRDRLQSIWSGATVSNDRVIAQLREWCQQAEASGIRALQDFATSLRGYTTAPAT